MPPTAVPFLYTARTQSRTHRHQRRAFYLRGSNTGQFSLYPIRHTNRSTVHREENRQANPRETHLPIVALLNHPRRFSTKYASDGTWKTRITNHEMPLCSEISADIAPETRQQSSHYYETSPSRFGKRPSQIEQLLTLFDQTKETLIPKSP